MVSRGATWPPRALGSYGKMSGMTSSGGRFDRPSTITTPRLRLDGLQPDDADTMMPVLDDERLHEFTGGEPLGLEQLRRRYGFLAAGRSPDGAELWLNWIVRRLPECEPIGTVQATVVADGAEADIAWIIGVPKRWNVSCATNRFTGCTSASSVCSPSSRNPSTPGSSRTSR